MKKLRVAILEDHLSIIDGYLYRLSKVPEIQVVATGRYGNELESMLMEHAADVLLLDIFVPTAVNNPNPFPILFTIPRLLHTHPNMKILVISMLNQYSLTETLVDEGISGYILKDDQASIQELGKIVTMIAGGGIYFSHAAYHARPGDAAPLLTSRQLEVLSLCAAFPDSTTIILAKQLGISSSTLRNLLSSAYLRLGVRTRAAAIAKVHQLGLIPVLGQPLTDSPPD